MKCDKCGALLLTPDQACPQCGNPPKGRSLASARSSSGDAVQSPVRPSQPSAAQDAQAVPGAPSFPTAQRDTAPVRFASYETPTDKALCARCMESFKDVAMYELGGKRYCERCFQIVVGDKQTPTHVGKQGRVELAVPPPPLSRTHYLLPILFRCGWLVLLIGFGVAIVVLSRPRHKSARVDEFDGPIAYRPTPSRHSPPDPAVEGPSQLQPGPETPAPPASARPAVDLPVVKGTSLIVCPVCGARLEWGPPARRITCPNCFRRMRIVEYDLVPKMKYVGREADGAILRTGGQERCLKIGQEVTPQSGVLLDRFVPDGLFFVKTVGLTMTEYRISPPQKVEKSIRLEKFVPKYREDETTEIAVVQGAPSITCDGHGTKEVYHEAPVEIRIDSTEPRVVTVPCPLPSCWKQFRVTVRAAPAIEVAIAPGAEEVPCPACGFVRHLTGAPFGLTFTCLKCKRAVRLIPEPVPDVVFRGVEGGAARIEHKGQTRLVPVGKEIWPGSQIVLDSFLEDGRAVVKRRNYVTFSDYHTDPPKERTLQLPVTWVLTQSADAP